MCITIRGRPRTNDLSEIPDLLRDVLLLHAGVARFSHQHSDSLCMHLNRRRILHSMYSEYLSHESIAPESHCSELTNESN